MKKFLDNYGLFVILWIILSSVVAIFIPKPVEYSLFNWIAGCFVGTAAIGFFGWLIVWFLYRVYKWLTTK